MKSSLISYLAVLSSLLIFTGCAGQATKVSLDSQTQACWLEHPINENRVGQFGLARDIYFGGEQPKAISRKRAVASLVDYLAPDLGIDSVLEHVDEKTVSLELAGITVHFVDDINIDGYVHSFASLNGHTPNQQKDLEQCQPQVCDISACNPKWLCTPSKDDEIAMLGVSYRATTPVEQHAKSIENALLQAEYMYGVDIVAHKDFRQQNSDYYRYNVLRQNGQVDSGEKESLSYAVTDRCFSRGTLFSRVALYGGLSQSAEKPVIDTQWLSNPKHLGYDGAIGAVQRPVASGLISDQIKLAIKRAAIQLAFEKQSTVSDETIVIQYNSGNSLLISYINEDTEVTLIAKVLSIHFKEGKGDRLEVFVWLARMN
jgi:hypothetical protein